MVEAWGEGIGGWRRGRLVRWVARGGGGLAGRGERWGRGGGGRGVGDLVSGEASVVRGKVGDGVLGQKEEGGLIGGRRE